MSTTAVAPDCYDINAIVMGIFWINIRIDRKAVGKGK